MFDVHAGSELVYVTVNTTWFHLVFAGGGVGRFRCLFRFLEKEGSIRSRSSVYHFRRGGGTEGGSKVQRIRRTYIGVVKRLQAAEVVIYKMQNRGLRISSSCSCRFPVRITHILSYPVQPSQAYAGFPSALCRRPRPRPRPHLSSRRKREGRGQTGRPTDGRGLEDGLGYPESPRAREHRAQSDSQNWTYTASNPTALMTAPRFASGNGHCGAAVT